MSIGAHIQTKHEIEYGNEHLEYEEDYVREGLLRWLVSHDVEVADHGDYEWRIDREGLKGLKDEDYNDMNDYAYDCPDDDVVVKSKVKDFVRDCLATNTGNYVYVSWFSNNK